MFDSVFEKHKLSGIGAASAATLLAALAANPSTTFLTVGLSGKLLYWALSKGFSGMASLGLVVMNVGASRLSTVITKAQFDGSFDSAERLIAAIRASGQELTDDQAKAIDDDVITAFRRFANLGGKPS